jgi:hypothetical protein
MKQFVRTIVAVLGIGLVSVIGCGGPTPAPTEKGDPSPSSKVETAPTVPAAPTPPGKTEIVKVVHEMDQAKQIVPDAKVMGSIGGIPFVPEALIEGDYLVFRTLNAETHAPDREIRIKLVAAGSARPFENRKLAVNQEMPVGTEVPEVLTRVPNRKDELALFPNGYALTLQLDVRVDGKVPGKIYLSLPDAEKTVIAGIFQAAYPRQPTEAPGPDDVPYIKGTVVVNGAAPNSTLQIGYVTNPNMDEYVGALFTELFEPALPIRWMQSNRDKKPVATLIAGDGKAVPSKYEFCKMPAGRYLVFAILKPMGPVAWKWVNVKPGDTLTVDLTIDTTQTGAVEIVVPIEAVTNVQMVPVEPGENKPMDQTLFTICALQLGQFGFEKPIVARKAIFKNLPPGRYEVRAGYQTRLVDIVAGKTVELEFEKIVVVP